MQQVVRRTFSLRLPHTYPQIPAPLRCRNPRRRYLHKGAGDIAAPSDPAIIPILSLSATASFAFLMVGAIS